MKKRNKILVAFLLVAVLVTGIAFAAIADTLEVGGNIALDMEALGDVFSQQIYFTTGSTAAKAAGNADATLVTIGEPEKDSAGDTDDKLTVSFGSGAFKNTKDAIVLKAKVKNDNPVDAVVTLKASASTQSCLSATAEETIVGAGQTVTVEITFTLDKIPAAAGDEFTGTYTVALEAVPAE